MYFSKINVFLITVKCIKNMHYNPVGAMLALWLCDPQVAGSNPVRDCHDYELFGVINIDVLILFNYVFISYMYNLKVDAIS